MVAGTPTTVPLSFSPFPLPPSLTMPQPRLLVVHTTFRLEDKRWQLDRLYVKLT